MMISSSGVDLVSAMRVLRKAGEIVRIIEEEKTNRYLIQEQASVIAEEIRAKRDVLIAMIDGEFSLRRDSLDQLATAICASAKAHQVEELKHFLQAFVSIVNGNPVESLMEMDRRIREQSFTLYLAKKHTNDD